MNRGVDGAHTDSRVVDEHVQPAEAVVELLDARLDGGVVADVELEPECAAADVRRDLLRPRAGGDPRSRPALPPAPAPRPSPAQALVPPVTRTRVSERSGIPGSFSLSPRGASRATAGARERGR